MLKPLFLVVALLSIAQAQQLTFNLATPEMPESSISYPKAADERLSADMDTVEYITQDGVTSVSPFPREIYSQQIAEKIQRGYRYLGLDGRSQYITVGGSDTWLKMGEYDAEPGQLLQEWALKSQNGRFYLARGGQYQAVNKLQPQKISSNNQSWCFYLINDYNESGFMRYDWLAVRMDKVSGQCG